MSLNNATIKSPTDISLKINGINTVVVQIINILNNRSNRVQNQIHQMMIYNNGF